MIGADEPFEIHTDHKNLEYFQQPQDIRRRQARWITQLAQYHFTLHHKPGTTHLKADFLSRPPNLDKGENDNKNTILLPSNHFCTLESRLYDAETVLEDNAYPIQKYACRTPFDKYDLQVKKALQSKNQDYYDDENGLNYYKNLLYIPPNVQLRTDIIQKHHDSIIAGHPGRFKTQELITRNYWWPGMQKHICLYINGCQACQRTKTHHEQPRNPLHPNCIPTEPWTHVVMRDICFQLELPFLAILFPSMENIFCSVFGGGLFNSFKVDR